MSSVSSVSSSTPVCEQCTKQCNEYFRTPRASRPTLKRPLAKVLPLPKIAREERNTYSCLPSSLVRVLIGPILMTFSHIRNKHQGQLEPSTTFQSFWRRRRPAHKGTQIRVDELEGFFRFVYVLLRRLRQARPPNATPLKCVTSLTISVHFL